jgi:hypothetical protein
MTCTFLPNQDVSSSTYSECDTVEARYDEYYREIHNISAICPDDHIQRGHQAKMDNPYLNI